MRVSIRDVALQSVMMTRGLRLLVTIQPLIGDLIACFCFVSVVF